MLVAAEACDFEWERGSFRFRVGEDLVFVIADECDPVVAVDEVVRVDGNLAAAAGGVDDELGDGVAGGVAAELFDDFDAFSDAGAEV